MRNLESMFSENNKPSEELVEKFRKILDDVETNENSIQSFLEEHSELIPLPILEGHQLHNSVVISKLPINGGLISDFAYLTKCSDCWNLVLIELEDSKKKLFLKDNENIRFTSEFNNAYDQILSWRAYINENKAILKEKVSKLLTPIQMKNLPFKVSYILIIGRNKDKKNSERKIEMFYQKNQQDILVKTYDSVISEYLKKPHQIYKIILSPWKDKGFKIKKVPNREVETYLFSTMTTDDLKIEAGARDRLMKQGYCIDKWEKGEFLTEDGKYDIKTKIEMVGENIFQRKFLEARLKENQK
ncbi:MAG: Shedu anti-phage system protein SduA domain-containing protein [Sarcina sp.]